MDDPDVEEGLVEHEERVEEEEDGDEGGDRGDEQGKVGTGKV